MVVMIWADLARLLSGETLVGNPRLSARENRA